MKKKIPPIFIFILFNLTLISQSTLQTPEGFFLITKQGDTTNLFSPTQPKHITAGTSTDLDYRLGLYLMQPIPVEMDGLTVDSVLVNYRHYVDGYESLVTLHMTNGQRGNSIPISTTGKMKGQGPFVLRGNGRRLIGGYMTCLLISSRITNGQLAKDGDATGLTYDITLKPFNK